MTLVSILIPVYNREEWIGACVQSALDQTFDDFEVIVCDNQSTDGTWKICQAFARGDSRVRIFRNDVNLGPVCNWQRSIREARGEIGKFLFSDDLLTPTCLAETVGFLGDPEVGMALSAADICGNVQYLWDGHSGKISSSAYLWAMLRNGRLPVSPGAALLRMKDLRKNLIDFGKHGIGPDLLLLLLTAASYPSIAYIPRPLALFRNHPNSISTLRRKELWRGYAWARARFLFSLFSIARTMHT